MSPGSDFGDVENEETAEEVIDAHERTEIEVSHGELTQGATVLAPVANKEPVSPKLPAARPTVSDSTDRIRERPHRDDPLLGTVLHGYRLVEPLGKGSYARVYRAIHEILEFQCAVKVLAEPNESAAKRLLREAKFLSAVQHENLVTVHDCGTTSEGRPWFSMELLVGRTLGAALKSEAPMTLGRVERLARQIANGLASAHERGLVHRDLKPANIMLVDHHGVEWVKILDFGVARALVPEDAEALTRVNQVVGTPVYMAPEQVMKSSAVGPAADLYALGILMFEMLAGHPPFRGGGAAKVMEQQLRADPPKLPPCGGFEDLIAELLAKDPAKRPASAKAVLERIDAITKVVADEWRGETTATLGEVDLVRGVEKGAGSPGTHRALLTGASVMLVTLALILAGLLLTRDPERPAESVVIEEPSRPPEPEPMPAKEPTEAIKLDEPTEPKNLERPEPQKERPEPDRRAEPKRAAKSPEAGLAVKAVRASLESRVARLGLSMKDLESIPELAEPIRGLESAIAAQDATLARAAADGVYEAARAHPIPTDVLERRTKRIFDELGRKSASLPLEIYDPLEAQYLELRQMVKPNLGAMQSRDLLKRIMELENKVRAAGGP